MYVCLYLCYCFENVRVTKHKHCCRKINETHYCPIINETSISKYKHCFVIKLKLILNLYGSYNLIRPVYTYCWTKTSTLPLILFMGYPV